MHLNSKRVLKKISIHGKQKRKKNQKDLRRAIRENDESTGVLLIFYGHESTAHLIICLSTIYLRKDYLFVGVEGWN